MIKVGIVDYKCGNIRSLFNALDYISANPFIISEEKDFNNASHAVLPGVGAFGYCANNLDKSGLLEPLKKHILNNKPLLGICVGMQLMLDSSEELGTFQGLSLMQGKIEGLKNYIKDKNIKFLMLDGMKSNSLIQINIFLLQMDMIFILITHMHLSALTKNLLLEFQIMELNSLQLFQRTIYLLVNFIQKRVKRMD